MKSKDLYEYRASLGLNDLYLRSSTSPIAVVALESFLIGLRASSNKNSKISFSLPLELFFGKFEVNFGKRYFSTTGTSCYYVLYGSYTEKGRCSRVNIPYQPLYDKNKKLIEQIIEQIEKFKEI